MERADKLRLMPRRSYIGYCDESGTQRVRQDFLHACWHGNYRVNAAGASPSQLECSAGLIFAHWVQHPRVICGGRISGIECFTTAVVVGLGMKLSDFGTRWSSYFVLIGGATSLAMGVAPEI